MSAITLPKETTKEIKLSGLPKYDDDVFPRIEKGEKVFNWYAGLFSVYWFAYKGMWTEWFVYCISYLLAYSVAEALHLNVLMIGMSIGFIGLVGRTANKKYLNHLKGGLHKKDNIGFGIGGFVGYMVIAVFAANFIGAFMPAFTKSFRQAAKQSQTNSSSQRNIASDSRPDYTQSSMAIMDGNQAVGKSLQFNGMFIGVQTIQDTPVLLVSDIQAGTQWWITISEAHRNSLAQMKVGASYRFECIISEIETAMNICDLK